MSTTIAILSFLGTCTVRRKHVPWNIAYMKRLSNPLVEAMIEVLNARPNDNLAIIPVNIKQFRFFFDVWPKHLYFWADTKSISRKYRWCLLSGYVSFQAKECLCPHMKRDYRKLTQMSACLQWKACCHVSNTPFRIKTVKYVVWRSINLPKIRIFITKTNN